MMGQEENRLRTHVDRGRQAMGNLSLYVVVGLLLMTCSNTLAQEEPALSLPAGSLIDDSEDEQIKATKDSANGLLIAKDYDGLEKLAASDRAAKSFLGSGMVPIGFFYEGVLGEPPTNVSYVSPARLDALKAWSAARPDSVTAKIALARALNAVGWNSRGGGYANTVTEDKWSAFEQKLHEATDVLNSVQDKRQSYPDWYPTMNMIGRGLGENKDAFIARNEEATKLFPSSIEILTGPLLNFLPRWNGSNQEVLDYATAAADKVGGDDGDILYARLASRLWMNTYEPGLFSDMGFSWHRVRHGMELIANHHPHSKIMANTFCKFAYLVQDHATAQVVFNRLGDRYMYWVWGPREKFQAAQAWAESK
jgi:hypothetical protein